MVNIEEYVEEVDDDEVIVTVDSRGLLVSESNTSAKPHVPGPTPVSTRTRVDKTSKSRSKQLSSSKIKEFEVVDGTVVAKGDANKRVDDDIKADVEKELGNEAFRDKDYDTAVEHYTEALSALCQSSSTRLKLSLLLNRAQSYLKLEDFLSAKADCTLALEFDASSVKALYRGACACVGLQECEQAVRWLREAQRIVPEEVEVGALLQRCERAAAAATQGERVAAAAAQAREEHGCAWVGGDNLVVRPGGSGLLAVEELVRLLIDGGEDPEDEQVGGKIPLRVDVRSVLGQLSKVLGEHPDHRIHFQNCLGHLAVMLYFEEADLVGPAAEVLRVFGSGTQDLQQHQPSGEMTARGGGGGEGGRGPVSQHSGRKPHEEESCGALWPLSLLCRLQALLTLDFTPPQVAVAAMRLLECAASDVAQRTGALVQPVAAATLLNTRKEDQEGPFPFISPSSSSPGESSASLLQRLVRAAAVGLPSQQEGKGNGNGKGGPPSPPPPLPAQCYVALCNLLRHFSKDAASRAALGEAGVQPLSFLLAVYQAAPHLKDHTTTALGSQPHQDPTRLPPSLQAATSAQEAASYINSMKKELYNPTAVEVRRAALLAFASLCKDSGLLRPEAFQRKSDKTGRIRITASPLISRVLEILGQLRDQAPLKTAVCLGLDGKPKSYEKRPYAADYINNPTGDMLVNMPDVAVEHTGQSDLIVDTDQGGADIEEGKNVTLIELVLDAVINLASNRNAARTLHSSGALATLERMWDYTTEAVLYRVQRVYTRMSLQCDGVLEELAASSGALPLNGLLWSSEERVLLRGLERLQCVAATLSGDHFALITNPQGGLRAVHSLLCRLDADPEHVRDPAAAGGRGGFTLYSTAQQVFLQCLERARGNNAGKAQSCRPPSGGVWDTLGPMEVLRMEERITGIKRTKTTSTSRPSPSSASSRRQGGMGSGTAGGRDATRESTTTTTTTTTTNNNNTTTSGTSSTRREDQQGAANTATNTNRNPGTSSSSTSSTSPSSVKLKPLPWDPTPLPTTTATAAAAAGRSHQGGGGVSRKGTAIKAGFFGPARKGRRGRAAEAEARQARQAEREEIMTRAQEAQDTLRAHAEEWAVEDEKSVPGGGVDGDEFDVEFEEEYARWKAEQAQEVERRKQEAIKKASKLQGGSVSKNSKGASKPEERKKEEEEYDEDGLRVKWNSGPSQELKDLRRQWLNTDLREKLRWNQGSGEVSVHVKVPPGTRARDVAVEVTPTRLMLKLHWYGRVLDGPLFRRCKAGESWWVLQDDEVQIMLPKDDGYFWKGLFEGGEEKSHYEVLKDLVASDDAPVPYDELPERAKDLIFDMQEHQELINEGMIDPDGFDDFRVVIGDGDGAK